MKGPFKAVKITDKIYWVGAIDWAIRNFHGYKTSRGTTYNAYLIIDEKVTLMDTVKAPFKDEMMSRISSIIEPEKIDIIISNHSEMDHSGCLVDAINIMKPEKIYASAMGVKALESHFHAHENIIAVKEGEKISLGSLSVQFFETRMLHWPDSMFSYIPEEKILISQDGFGMHLASYERFDDEIDEYILEWEAAKYYANILLPFSPMVKQTLEKVKKAGIEINMILPDHGPVWRKNPGKIVGLYAKWAEQKPENKAVVVYDTMWHSTELMARAIGEGLFAGGAKAKLMPLEANHRSDVATEILNAGALIAGSPTMNNNLFPTLADVLTYLRGLKPLNLIGAAFGSYGWGGQSVKQVEDYLKEMKIEIVSEEELKINYVPAEDDLKRCFELGIKVAEKLKEYSK